MAVSFFQQTRDELTKVTWPTRDEVVRLTGVVIIVSILIGVYIGGLDFILTSVLQNVAK